QMSVLSQAASVLSQTLSGLSAKADTISNALSALSQAASVLSNVISATGGFVQRELTGTVVVSAGALSNVSGMSWTVSAGNVYNMHGIVLFNVSAVTVPGLGFGLSYPAMTRAFGKMEMAVSVGQQAAAAPKTGMYTGYFNAGHSNTAIVSTTSTWGGAIASVRGLFIDAVFMVSTTGTIQLLAKGNAGVSAINVLPGSFVRVYKVG